MNEAIKLAIEKGGYEFRNYLNNEDAHLMSLPFKEVESIILDPLFWQSLGKALGWGQKDKLFTFAYSDNSTSIAHSGFRDEWQFHAHQYFDIKMTNGNEEEFWKGLLNDVR